MAESGRHVWQYRPGEVIIAAELPEAEDEHRQAHAIVGRAIEDQLAGQAAGVLHAQQRRPQPIVFRAPGRAPLGFLFYDLADQDALSTVKHVVSRVHADGLAALQPAQQTGISVVGAMPHWLGSALQDFGDGSPASLPSPAQPPGSGSWQYRYTPHNARLDLRRQVEQVADRSLVPVLVLDTSPDWAAARSQAERFGATNPQLRTVVDLLSARPLPDWHLAAMRELQAEQLKRTPAPDGRPRGHLEADHGLFVAGLIHDLAPRAELSLRPVLNPWGVGDLHLLLSVLAEVVAAKSIEQPLVINMSLGFLPKFEHLHWMWYGLQPLNDPEFVPDQPLPGQPRDKTWLAGHRDEVEASVRLLHSGVERLTSYLLANNCLGIAAAGNDSLQRVKTNRQRFGPRVPARYESVLGVAATTSDPTQAAPYSNIGDELELGDHIATFGGSVNDADETVDGVVGLYTAERFPVADGKPVPLNDSGWANWSGTSFATALAAGMVANYWAAERARTADTRAEAVLIGFNSLAESYAPTLRTPSIGIQGEWQHLG